MVSEAHCRALKDVIFVDWFRFPVGVVVLDVCIVEWKINNSSARNK